jgi:hypothetical protein
MRRRRTLVFSKHELAADILKTSDKCAKIYLIAKTARSKAFWRLPPEKLRALKTEPRQTPVFYAGEPSFVKLAPEDRRFY